MKNFLKVIFFSLFSTISTGIYSQSLTVNNSLLNFGNVFENSPDSLPLTIRNITAHDILVSNIKFYSTYSLPAFSASSSWFIIPGGDSATVFIRFNPRHNIFHNSELIIENDGMRGSINVNLHGQGKYSNHYYDLTENLAEENLKNAINLITGNGYVSLGYNVARDSMFMSIDNKKTNGQGASQNTLECIYTGREAVGYTDRSDCQTNFSFNTEHTFPQSFFSSMEPMKSDLQHLYPTDDVANNQRGDNPFGIVTNPSWNVGGSKSDGNIFEPRDEQKGASARSLFYFVLRYQNYSNFLTSQEAILRSWHQAYLPTFIEKQRNDDIFSVQHNRNPFVDYPMIIERIQSLSNNSVAPLVSMIDLPEDTIIYGIVPGGNTAIYNYVIVNNGNTNIQLSNFALTHPAELSFLSGGTDTTLAPGESHAVRINCSPVTSDSIGAFLSFNTSATGNSFVSVPVFVNDLLFNSTEDILSSASVYPVPAHDLIHVSFSKTIHEFEWIISDFTGRKFSAGSAQGQNSIISINGMTPGMYLLHIHSDGVVRNTKILIY